MLAISMTALAPAESSKTIIILVKVIFVERAGNESHCFLWKWPVRDNQEYQGAVKTRA